MYKVIYPIYTIFLFIYSVFSVEYTCNTNSSCGCSISSSVEISRIIGGEPAFNYTWSWIVSLQRFNRHTCGASLLTAEYAVTAAHCVYDVLDNKQILSILAGTNYLNDVTSDTIQRRSISSIIIHPQYDHDKLINDIAILKFSRLDVSLKSKLAFICLPEQNQELPAINQSLVAIGWGVTYSGSNIPSNYLQQITVQAFPSMSQVCQESGIANSALQFCAGIIEGGKDTCQGDSGGPLMAFANDRWILSGLTSSGIGCARPNTLGIYTRVSSYVSFINLYISSSSCSIINFNFITILSLAFSYISIVF